MSLAAFIGGRATGPRLNKHAPQQDATDPTLFEQRNIDPSTAPHPVFGRGGIAMPGLVSQGHKMDSPTPSSEHVPNASTQDHTPVAKHDQTLSNAEPFPISTDNHPSGKESSRPPRASASSAALKRYVQHVEQASSPQADKPSFGRDASRTRTMSTPAGAHPTIATTLPASQPLSRPISPHGAVSPRTPKLGARRSPPPALAYEPFKSLVHPSPKSSTSAFTTPRKPAAASVSSPAFSVKLPAFSAPTPSLPRPEAYSPQKAAPLTSQHRTPYLTPPKEKDPTPSISRLKGRGFVQSMVKASSALEAAAASSATSEVGRIGPARRSTPVADRWKPESSSSSQLATPPPQTSLRKSWTATVAIPSEQKNVSQQRKSWVTSEPLKVEEPDRKRPASALEKQNTGRSVRVVETHHTGRSSHAVEHQPTGGRSSKVLETQHVRKAPSLPSLSTPSRPATPPRASPGGHGLGSSSTMFSYIKPTKTGDEPATGPSHPHSRPATPRSHSSAADLTPTQDADELGHRTGTSSGGQGRRNGVAGFPVASGRPLVHVRP